MSTFNELLDQRHAAIDTLTELLHDLENKGEVFHTDAARIERIKQGLRDAGALPTETEKSV